MPGDTHSASLSPKDAARWQELWEEMMTQYCPGRASCFELALNTMAFMLKGEHLRVLDVGSGAFTKRARERFPDAQLAALDRSAKNLQLARVITGGERVNFVQLEVTGDWVAVGEASYDVAFLGWVTHEIAPWHLATLYANLFRVLRPDGLLLNADSMGSMAPGFRDMAQDMARERVESEWRDFDNVLSAREPLATLTRQDAAAARTRWNVRHTAVEHCQLLREAGFREAEEIWRYLNYGMVLAVR